MFCCVCVCIPHACLLSVQQSAPHCLKSSGPMLPSLLCQELQSHAPHFILCPLSSDTSSFRNLQENSFKEAHFHLLKWMDPGASGSPGSTQSSKESDGASIVVLLCLSLAHRSGQGCTGKWNFAVEYCRISRSEHQLQESEVT